MTILKAISYFIFALIFLFVGFGLYLPNEYRVERDITINAPADEIHIYVGNLSRWSKWTTWQSLDPQMEITILKAEGVGAEQRWISPTGTGNLKFIRSDEFYGVDYDLIFDGELPARAGIHYSIINNQTLVTWQMTGKADTLIFGPYAALMMDSIVGSTFQNSLVNLKARVEN